MKVSVVIPTYNHCDDLLKPCLESIKELTDLSQVEILVVANGCKDNTKEYVESLGDPFKLIWFDEPMGYTKSTNAGIQQATGEYIVLLNNDTKITFGPPHTWINLLLEPFYKDPKVGITGPMLAHCPEADRDFLIGFCICIKREMFDRFGILDEVFSPGYGEDTDFCCKVQDGGFKIVQVCPSSTYADDAHKVMVGSFPIWHAGNVTFHKWPGGEELLRHNNEILRQRYNNNKKNGIEYAEFSEINTDNKENIAELKSAPPPSHMTSEVNLSNANLLDGFMAPLELKWLATEAKKRKTIIEIGSWHGKSSRALGDNSMDGGIVYCVDTWNGSITEQATNHASAKMRDGDHAIYEFLQGNIDLISSGKMVPIRMSSKNAADFFKEKGIKADMIFIDAGHTEEELTQDIHAWAPVLADGGIFCGHDLGAWKGVNDAVEKNLEKFYCGEGTTIWYCEKKDIKTVITPTRKFKVFDCFPFNNELDILDRRFATLWDVVDRFIIVEALFTHANKPKELVFHNNLQRFEKYLSKVTYRVVEKFPDTSDSWALERYQRNFIMTGLENCQDDDVIIVTDCDEIPTANAIRGYTPDKGIMSLEMDLYYYNEHTRAKDPWFEGKILPYGLLKQLTPCGARYSTNAPRIPNAGKHLSYFGDVNRIIKKIEDTAHQEYNRPEYKDPEVIARRVANGEDVFGRNLKYERV